MLFAKSKNFASSTKWYFFQYSGQNQKKKIQKQGSKQTFPRIISCQKLLNIIGRTKIAFFYFPKAGIHERSADLKEKAEKCDIGSKSIDIKISIAFMRPPEHPGKMHERRRRLTRPVGYGSWIVSPPFFRSRQDAGRRYLVLLSQPCFPLLLNHLQHFFRERICCLYLCCWCNWPQLYIFKIVPGYWGLRSDSSFLPALRQFKHKVRKRLDCRIWVFS